MTEQLKANKLIEGTSQNPGAETHGDHKQQLFFRLLLVTVWFGLLTGLGEVSVKAVQKFGLGLFFDAGEAVQKFGFGPVVHASKDIVWMAPLAGLLSFMAPGLAILLIARLWRRIDALRMIAFVLTFLGLLNIFYMYPRFHSYGAMALAAGVAWQFSRFVAPRSEAFQRLVYRTVWLLIGVVVILAIATRGWQELSERRALAKLPPAPAQAPNVLFIVLDTVRAHNLSFHGYERTTSPNLDQLAKSGVVFDRALATAPWTLSSHAGMFTGRYPFELSADWKVPLDGAHPTLAEQFTRLGYLTAGFISNTSYCSYEHGLNRGFIHYEDYAVSLGQIASSLTLVRTIADDLRLRWLLSNDELLNRQSAEDVNGKFLRWLERAGGRPFFAFLNFYDAHEPYLPPAPFDRKFGPGRSRGKSSPMIHLSWDPTAGREKLSQAELQEEIDAYDGGIAYLDHQLGALFTELRNRGLYDNTLIVVTSDHGEEFDEHGLYSHGNSLYLPSVHVPLLVSLPGRTPAGQRVSDPVSLRDLPATVSELTGLQASFPGQTLTRFWARPDSAESGSGVPVLSTVRRVPGVPEWYPVSKGDMSSLVSEGYRYIKNGDGSEELYDFDRDVWEKNNLASRPDSRSLLERFRMKRDSALNLNHQQSENGRAEIAGRNGH
ncbi:MAG: sulfatase-like hydrolase/transferase [Blastocatellales bacterium]